MHFSGLEFGDVAVHVQASLMITFLEAFMRPMILGPPLLCVA